MKARVESVRRDGVRVITILFTLGVIPMMIWACATTGGNNGEGEASQLAYERFDDCFFASTLSDWRPLDDENLVAFTMGRRPYHVRLFRPAFNLSFQQTIAFYDRDGRICPFDEVVVDGVMTDRIQITSIRQLTDEQLNELYIEFGIRAPEVIVAPESAVE
jgi:hypothetical protein